jgi:hypothetical protein
MDRDPNSPRRLRRYVRLSKRNSSSSGNSPVRSSIMPPTARSTSTMASSAWFMSKPALAAVNGARYASLGSLLQ